MFVQKSIWSLVLLFFLSYSMQTQNVVKGILVDSDSGKKLEGVSVHIKDSSLSSTTKAEGRFLLQNFPNGTYLLVIKLQGYETQNFPIELTGNIIDLGVIGLYVDLSASIDPSIITLTDDELNGDVRAADNIAGLLQSSKDVFLRTAAFEFSASFFRLRGLDSDNAKLMINGIEMNKAYHGRPLWSNWGGLNDALRNQEFRFGLAASPYTFGGALGTTNINVRASSQRTGTRISYASSNRSYAHRFMLTHSSGISKNGWAYAFSLSKRTAEEGFTEGTKYNATSLFAALEKKFNEQHKISFTAIAAENKRGKAAPQTKEVFDLKGIQYNSYWGFQNGTIRNSRIRTIFEPLFIVNHDWKIGHKTTLNTNVSYQFGNIGNSRIDNNGSQVLEGTTDGSGNPYIVGLGTSNPDPTYYQKLPSYALRQGYLNVYEVQQHFIKDGQIDWNQLYQANVNIGNNGNASYVLYEDRNDDTQYTINTILDNELNENITLNGKVQYRKLKSENFANLLDLLGGNDYLDVDSYADTFDEKQNDLLNPLHRVGVGDTFKYNFNLKSRSIDAFAQVQFDYNKIDFYVAMSGSQTAHQREGLFKNGGFPDTSLTTTPKQEFTNFGAKLGGTYKFSGRHLLNLNAGYLTKAPHLRNTFSNARENDAVVDNLVSERILTSDASYLFRSPGIKAKITGHYTMLQDATEISFFFADGIGGDNTAFVQEILSGIDKKHFGVELGVEAKVTATITLRGAASIGQYTYDNNPNLYLTTENNSRSITAGFTNGRKNFGEANLKDYKLASGPQTAYSIGFDYRDPGYWFFGATANFFDNTYIDVAPLTRTNNFTDDGGIPFNDYDENIARQLLEQEQFDSYMVVNLIGGKSWKIGAHYINFFGSIGNLFNTKYTSGGFEQGRNANYRQLKEDKALETPVFGNKYWFGRGTTYFLNLSYQF